MKNPEDHVLDAIDELVNETMTAGLDQWGEPRDNYLANYYPNCPQCGCDWHGVECDYCGCPRSEGEVAKTYDAPRRDIDFRIITPEEAGSLAPGIITPMSENQDGASILRTPLPSAPWVIDHNTAGYTLADLERLRAESHILRDYPQRYVMGDRPTPRIRFWACIGDRLQVVEGVAQMMRIEWNMDGAALEVRLDPFERHDLVWAQTFELDLVPAGDVPEGMITMEGFTPGGPGGQRGAWAVVGRLRPSDLDIETNTEYIFNLDGDTVRADEQCRATIRLTRAQVEESWVIE